MFAPSACLHRIKPCLLSQIRLKSYTDASALAILPAYVPFVYCYCLLLLLCTLHLANAQMLQLLTPLLSVCANFLFHRVCFTP
jgi:hypothetical protein